MSREPSTVDAGAWTGMSDWPSPKDYPRPSPLYAKPSTGKHLIASGFAVALGLVAVQEFYAPAKPGTVRWLSMGLTIFATVAFAFVTLRRLYRSSGTQQWLVRMDSSGLSIPGWFEDVVPWSEIEQADYLPVWTPVPARGLHITVRDESRFRPTIRRQWSPLIPFANILWLLDVPQKEMFVAIQAHRAHFGNGGDAT